MRKQNLFYMAAALLMGTATLSSCSSDELPVDNVLQTATETARTYSFSASALMDGGADTRVFEIGEDTISSRFSENDGVWVYIKKSNGDIAYGDKYLYPTNISEDGKSCTLAADSLQFISHTNGFKPEVGDKVYLYYGIFVYGGYALEGSYSFSDNGTKDNVERFMDYCLAEMVVTGVEEESGKLTFGQIENPNKTSFIFRNINSVFRQKLTFVDKNGNPVTPDIHQVFISSTGKKTVINYFPFRAEPYGYAPLICRFDKNDTYGSVYFSTMFNDENKNDSIVITAFDDESKTYSLTKAAPEGGFQNNKYYYGDAKLKWVSDPIVPTITGMGDYIRHSLGKGFAYEINDDPADITIKGKSENNSFVLLKGGTVTLDSINAICESLFLYVSENAGTDLTLILNGNENSISAQNVVFWGGDKDLQLKCKGDQATLTITLNEDYGKNFCGFEGFPNLNLSASGTYNYADAIMNDTDAGYDALQAVAADDDNDGTPDYTIQRSAMTDNQDGTYTWTYIVTKIKKEN